MAFSIVDLTLGHGTVRRLPWSCFLHTPDPPWPCTRMALSRTRPVLVICPLARSLTRWRSLAHPSAPLAPLANALLLLLLLLLFSLLSQMPGWFALGALPLLHIVAYKLIIDVLTPNMAKFVANADFREGVDDRHVALLAVFVAFLMHLGTFYPYLVVSGVQSGVDNETPRSKRPTDSSLAGRLYAAHLNQVESFPGFAAAVLAAICLGSNAGVAGGATSNVAVLAWLHVGFRCVYWVLYVVNVPNLRTLAYVCSFHCTVYIFGTAFVGSKWTP